MQALLTPIMIKMLGGGLTWVPLIPLTKSLFTIALIAVKIDWITTELLFPLNQLIPIKQTSLTLLILKPSLIWANKANKVAMSKFNY
jgi:hypothetical protein